MNLNLKIKYVSPEALTINLRTDTIMVESPVTGDIFPVPWESGLEDADL